MFSIFSKYKKLNLGVSNTISLLGWETVDIKDAHHIVDFRKDKLPFSDNSCALIYSSHLIEHLTDEILIKLFSEIYRVLKKGGIFRVACPDMDLVIDAVINDNLDFFFQNPRTRMFLIKGVNSGTLSKESLLIHNNLIRVFASYADTGEGPLVDRAIVEENIKKLNKYDFAKWCVSLLDKHRMRDDQPWGHVNAFDYDKLRNMLEPIGFRSIKKSSFRRSGVKEINMKELDLERHKWFSLYVEAKK